MSSLNQALDQLDHLLIPKTDYGIGEPKVNPTGSTKVLTIYLCCVYFSLQDPRILFGQASQELSSCLRVSFSNRYIFRSFKNKDPNSILYLAYHAFFFLTNTKFEFCISKKQFLPSIPSYLLPVPLLWFSVSIDTYYSIAFREFFFSFLFFFLSFYLFF